MAEIVRRRSWGGVLPLGRHVSISGSSFIQCASASIAPPHPGGAKCYPGAEVQGRTGSRLTTTPEKKNGSDRAMVNSVHTTTVITEAGKFVTIVSWIRSARTLVRANPSDATLR